eukprot:TRINITY_DN5376_c0_g1_i17.p3 TRINITY_DN5376_c0_g1~~TRINITY_DN5376_c0_g1_i17.p3  ORF type:complete len:107 (-),score=19.09 TRINITY_DN5376_c0_g1_i17:106-426(-)
MWRPSDHQAVEWLFARSGLLDSHTLDTAVGLVKVPGAGLLERVNPPCSNDHGVHSYIQPPFRSTARMLAVSKHKRHSLNLSLIHISEPTRLLSISYAVFCLKKKKK